MEEKLRAKHIKTERGLLGCTKGAEGAGYQAFAGAPVFTLVWFSLALQNSWDKLAEHSNDRFNTELRFAGTLRQMNKAAKEANNDEWDLC